jgi:hypothetical protein
VEEEEGGESRTKIPGLKLMTVEQHLQLEVVEEGEGRPFITITSIPLVARRFHFSLLYVHELTMF